jgi:hypothetical protein
MFVAANMNGGSTSPKPMPLIRMTMNTVTIKLQKPAGRRAMNDSRLRRFLPGDPPRNRRAYYPGKPYSCKNYGSVGRSVARDASLAGDCRLFVFELYPATFQGREISVAQETLRCCITF